MENIFVASTNIFVVYPIFECYLARDYLTASVLAFVGFFSFVSHLAENHKHGMPGVLGVDRCDSYLLNRLDVLGVILTVLRVGYVFLNGIQMTFIFIYEYPYLLFAFFVLVFFNLSSEFDKTPDTKYLYVFLHSVWHIGIFYWLGYTLSIYYWMGAPPSVYN